ncbi:MAG: alpha/beta hydrolase-fold protein [Candidatus Acidiferrales bacterium]
MATRQGARAFDQVRRACAQFAMLLALILLGAMPGVADSNRVKHAAKAAPLRFEISYAKNLSASPLDGRVYLLISKSGEDEPRFAISYMGDSQQIFGVDVDGLAAETPVAFDRTVPGAPVASIENIPAGDYTVQGLLNIYETFHRADGHVLKLPMDRGEGQHWNSKPGNLYSKPQKLRIDPATGGVIKIELTEKIPAIDAPQDTKYVKHLHIQSELLTKFWGRPMELGAIVLLPEGFDEHPEAHYPLVVLQGHFSHDIFDGLGFRTEPPAPDSKGTEKLVAEYSYKFYQDWTSGRMPHVILIEIQHANPYYDDSYAVNTANVGPYGDAITQELIPAVEKKYRGIGQGWARALYGGSTGGWETLASQVFYPDFYNGAWTMCPDPVDFHAYMSVDIYNDKNAFAYDEPWSHIARPLARTPDDQTLQTIEGMSKIESALGSHGRSTEQLGIFDAVFGPMGDDGYPKPIWNPETGDIDRDVAAYWREHFDLDYILERDWKTLGPKLVGKIHVRVGTRDTFYLDNAVRLLQKFLESTNDPYYAGDFEFGPHMPHCFTGDPHMPVKSDDIHETMMYGWLTFNERILPLAAAHIEKTAPKGADMSWKY